MNFSINITGDCCPVPPLSGMQSLWGIGTTIGNNLYLMRNKYRAALP